MTTVSLSLRAPDPDGDDDLVYEDVDLDALTPRARALAEAVAQSVLRTRTDVLMESDSGELMSWRGWSTYPHDATRSAVAYLEGEARKIPVGWHVYGRSVDRPVPSRAAAAADRYLTRDAAIRALGLTPHGWDTLRRAKHLPAPDRYVQGQPEWLEDTIDAYRTRERELWPISRIAEYLGYSGTPATARASARRQMGLWALPCEGRAPGRGGESLYAADQVQAAHAARPGQGARTDLSR
ncbi:hypothetical protein [Streptomyces sp. NPDC015131]|uniref:hypothetical protein n=1 Tax=Streptomyces sp. NPDC015131 TaxID=3364941 RepID=UPI0036F58F18